MHDQDWYANQFGQGNRPVGCLTLDRHGAGRGMITGPGIPLPLGIVAQKVDRVLERSDQSRQDIAWVQSGVAAATYQPELP